MTVQNRLDAQIARVGQFIGGHQAGTQWTERIKGLSATPLAAAPNDLPIPRADIVRAGVTEHVIECLIARNVLATFANNDGQFAFVVDLVTGQMARQQDRLPGMLDGRRYLHEQHRVLRDRCAAFRGMVTVVQSDTQQGRWSKGSQSFAERDRLFGIPIFAQQFATQSRGHLIRMLNGETDLT